MTWKGLIAATFTPMRSDGSVALELIPEYAEMLISAGCSGVYICGSTGEGPSLTTNERTGLAEAWIQAAAGRLTIIVQVGHNSIREAQSLARHAVEHGADAISATPPAYFPLADGEELLACMEDVASAAPGLPFYYYHIPMRTGVQCDVAELLRLGSERIPTLAGVKFSDYRQFDLQRAVDTAAGKLDVFTGVDEMLLGSLSIGVNGAVGTTYNFAAPLYEAVVDAYQRGDLQEAREGQSMAVNMITAVVKTCGSSGFKALMPMRGIDCGPSRLPLRTPSAAQVKQLQDKLKGMGFWEKFRSG